MKGVRVAPRFAKALLSLSEELKAEKAVAEDMRLITDTISDNRELGLLLQSPILNADKKISVLTKIFEGKVHDVTIKFVTLLTNKKREGALEAIADSYLHYFRIANDVVKAEVVSAVELSKANKDAVIAKIKERFSAKEIELSESVNQDLIGGMVVKVNDLQLDMSISGKITGLRKELLN
jgi:F-type H+-transporting ATPase subunit delta